MPGLGAMLLQLNSCCLGPYRTGWPNSLTGREKADILRNGVPSRALLWHPQHEYLTSMGTLLGERSVGPVWRIISAYGLQYPPGKSGLRL